MIDQHTIDLINDSTDIVKLVSNYVKLSPKGSNFFGLCPFHDDHNASFSVNPGKKIAKCMSCGEGGRPINFLRKIKNISFDEAAIELAELANIPVEKKVYKVDKNQKFYDMNEATCKFYESVIDKTKNGDLAKEYLNKRGISNENINKFRIGLSPVSSNSLYKYLHECGYADVDIVDNGLAKQGEHGYYDIFSNRVMFPIIDDKNRVLGFSARIYYESDTEPRYINSTETSVYKKGECLFNLNNAIPHIRKIGYVILCEGQMDAISMYINGIGNAICSLGTALTENQVKLISKYTKNIMIMYDGDEAGIKATKKAFKLLKGFNAKSVTLTGAKDPDEFIKTYGVNELIKFIKDNAIDPEEFLYRNAFQGKDLNVSYDYEEAKSAVFAFLVTETSKSLVESYLRRLAADLKVSFDAIYSDYRIFATRKVKRNDEIIDNQVEEKKDIPLSHEMMYLTLSMFDKKYFDRFNEEISDIGAYTESNLVINTFIAMSSFYSSGNNGFDQITRYCALDVGNEFIIKIYDEVNKVVSFDDKTISKIISDTIKRFKEIKYKKDLQKISIESRNVDDDTITALEKKLKLARENVSNPVHKKK